LFDLLQSGSQHVKLFLPVFAIAVDPNRDREDWPSNQTASTDAAGPFLFHKSGPHKHLNVSRHGLQ
jgi:hypothetical protein